MPQSKTYTKRVVRNLYNVVLNARLCHLLILTSIVIPWYELYFNIGFSSIINTVFFTDLNLRWFRLENPIFMLENVILLVK